MSERPLRDETTRFSIFTVIPDKNIAGRDGVTDDCDGAENNFVHGLERTTCPIAVLSDFVLMNQVFHSVFVFPLDTDDTMRFLQFG